MNTDVITESRFVEIIEAMGDAMRFEDIGCTRVYQGRHEDLGNVVITHNPIDGHMLLVRAA